jgi:hypothetical protein
MGGTNGTGHTTLFPISTTQTTTSTNANLASAPVDHSQAYSARDATSLIPLEGTLSRLSQPYTGTHSKSLATSPNIMGTSELLGTHCSAAISFAQVQAILENVWSTSQHPSPHS